MLDFPFLSTAIVDSRKHREGFFRAKPFKEIHRIKHTEYYAGRVKCAEHSTQSEVHQTEVSASRGVHRVKCIVHRVKYIKVNYIE